MAISALEQQLTNGWIPVSERLPTQEDIEKNGSDWFTTTVRINNEREIVDEERYRPLKFDADNNQIYGFGRNTTAWKYLSEPYKTNY